MPGPISTFSYVRKLVDVIGHFPEDGKEPKVDQGSGTDDPPCLVFEWMDKKLWTVPSDSFAKVR